MTLKIPPIVQVLITATWMIAARQFFPVAKITFPFRKGLSFIFFLSGLAISLNGVSTFRRTKTTTNPLHPEKSSALVTSGIYTLTRNPMYVGMAFILTSLAIYVENLLAFLAIPMFIGYLTQFQIIPEEKILHQLFGTDYQNYCLRVRRWL